MTRNSTEQMRDRSIDAERRRKSFGGRVFQPCVKDEHVSKGVVEVPIQ